MNQSIIGRDAEQQVLTDILNSPDPEFVAIYGRRRVGKTHLILNFFEQKDCYLCHISGMKKGRLKEQIEHFTTAFSSTFHGGLELAPKTSWDATFKLVTKTLKELNSNKQIVLFFDEFPWMVTPKSRLLEALDYYWNHYWSRDSRIKLIICGSSASWIIDKIVNNKGGLHNRMTASILVEPFNLHDTKQLLRHRKVKLNHKQISEIYMMTGGIPYYLCQIKPGLSAAENCEQLAFKHNSFFMKEFDNLFSSLFKSSEEYVELVRIIAASRYGVSQSDILKQSKLTSKGGTLVKRLKSLEEAGFIISLMPYQHQRQGLYYRVIDEYTLFYLHWIEPVKNTLQKRALQKGYWESMYTSPAWHIWTGYAFEALCYKHLLEIRVALNISPSAIANTWRYVPKKGAKELGAQIDLLFDRQDDSITLCEIKFHNARFKIDKSYYEVLRRKAEVFRSITRTKKQFFYAMITLNGLSESMYKEELIEACVTLDDLFKKVE